uniref:Uncharacterized protein n=1 Tax=Oryza punctata TaxID=4537 RepID=A0A0E0KLF1_ORYPU
MSIHASALVSICSPWAVRVIVGSSRIEREWQMAKRSIHAHITQGLKSAFLTTLWEIWMERNNRIFRGIESTSTALASKIIDELHLWELAGAKGVQRIISRD